MQKGFSGAMVFLVIFAYLIGTQPRGLGLCSRSGALVAASKAAGESGPGEKAMRKKHKGWMEQIKPPEPGYRLRMVPAIKPHRVVHVGHHVKSMWLARGARRAILALSWSAEPHHYSRETHRCCVREYDLRSGKKLWQSRTVKDAVCRGLVIDQENNLFLFATRWKKKLWVGDLRSKHITDAIALGPLSPRQICGAKRGDVLVSGTQRGGKSSESTVLLVDPIKSEIVRRGKYPYLSATKVWRVNGLEGYACDFWNVEKGVGEKGVGGVGRCFLLDEGTLERNKRLTTGRQGVSSLAFSDISGILYMGRSNIGTDVAPAIEAQKVGDDNLLFRISEPLQGPWKGGKRPIFSPRSLDCSPDGQILLCAGAGPIRFYDAKDGHLIGKIELEFIRRNEKTRSGWQYMDPSLAKFDPTGRFVVVFCGRHLFVWSTEKIVRQLRGKGQDH